MLKIFQIENNDTSSKSNKSRYFNKRNLLLLLLLLIVLMLCIPAVFLAKPKVNTKNNTFTTDNDPFTNESHKNKNNSATIPKDKLANNHSFKSEYNNPPQSAETHESTRKLLFQDLPADPNLKLKSISNKKVSLAPDAKTPTSSICSGKMDGLNEANFHIYNKNLINDEATKENLQVEKKLETNSQMASSKVITEFPMDKSSADCKRNDQTLVDNKFKNQDNKLTQDYIFNLEMTKPSKINLPSSQKTSFEKQANHKISCSIKQAPLENFQSAMQFHGPKLIISKNKN